MLFSEVGQIVEVFMPSDRMTGRPRGFAFVEFVDAESIPEAIEKFDGYELKGRKIRINEAEEQQPRTAPHFSNSKPGGGGFYGKSKKKSKGSRRNIRAKKRGGF